MRFISVHQVSTLLEFKASLTSQEGMAAFMDVLKINQDKIIQSSEADELSFQCFVQSLSQPETLVFQSWIEQSPALVVFLKCGIPTNAYTNQQLVLQHSLFPSYQKYLTPFLSPIIRKYEREEVLSLFSHAFSFVPLLNNDHRGVIEVQFGKTILDQLSLLLKRIGSTKEEQELVKVLTPLCSDEVIQVMNHFSRASYATKIAYIDLVLQILQLPACSQRLANWLLKQLQKMELNAEHSAEIEVLLLDLKEGKLKINNALRSKTNSFSIKQLAAGLLLLGLLVFTLFIILGQPFDDNLPEQISPETSFTQFSPEERIRIDSLLQVAQNKQAKEGNEIDQGFSTVGGSASLSSKTPLFNKTMEKLYQFYRWDEELSDKERAINSSKLDSIKQKKQRYKGFSNLEQRKGEQEVLIRNDSEFAVQLYVFENKLRGKAFSLFIEKQETIRFKMNLEEVLMFVPGNNLGKIKQKENEKYNQFSAEFDHHFCEVDDNYSEGFSKSYRLVTARAQATKFLLSGTFNGYFELLDVNGVLVRQ